MSERLPSQLELEKKDLDKKELSPEEVEKLIMDHSSDFNVEDPAGQASKFFGIYSPVYRRTIRAMSKKQLIRQLDALTIAPYWDTLPQWSKDEERMFEVGERLIQAKLIMVSMQFNEAEERKLREQLKKENENGRTEQNKMEPDSDRIGKETEG